MMTTILMRMFGRPQGGLGKLGGHIMAHMNTQCGAWVIDLLQISSNDSILEVGFGPGAIVGRLAKVATEGRIAGVDPSPEMVEQARARNVTAIEARRVDLRRGIVESLPFDDNSFDKPLAINSMQVWSDVEAGLREVLRVLKPRARIALGFTPYSGRTKEGLAEKLIAAGFTGASIAEEKRMGFCVLATKP
jgi:ubiquinone/menaquinone biosynthesis C-methylase UbiE